MTRAPSDDALGGPPHPSSSVRARRSAAAVGRWLRSSSYLQRWIVLGIAIGAIAGLGAVVFYEALRLCTHFFLEVLAGYRVPTPDAEGHVAGLRTPPDPGHCLWSRGAVPCSEHFSSTALPLKPKVMAPTPPSPQCTTTPKACVSGPSSSRSSPRH